MFSKIATVSFALLASSSLVAGHAAIIGATGDAGGAGSAIGVDPNTPRDGTGRQPFQQDSTRFKGDAAATCGETLGGGTNDVQAGTAMVMQLNGATLPQITPGGTVSMTLHQVNGDGAGPYTCMMDATGTGNGPWTAMTVTTQVDGNARGRNNDNAKTDLPLVAAVPAGQTCTGTVAGQANVCMVRCMNPARAGPFGGCVPVQMAGAAAPAAGAVAPAAAGAVAPAAGTVAPAAAGVVAPAAGAAVPATAVPAAAVPATGVAAGTIPAAGAVGAVPATGSIAPASAVVPATGAAGVVPATGAVSPAGAVAPAVGAASVAQRSPKKVGGVIVTDDEDEEEIY